MNLIKTQIITAAVAALSTAGFAVAGEDCHSCAPGQTVQISTDARSAEMSPEQAKQTEKSFVKWASNGHLFAIEAAKIAQDKADHEYVRQLAKQLQQDHEQAYQMLTDAVEGTEYEARDEITLDLLSDKLEMMRSDKDDDFDAAYVFGRSGDAVDATLWYAYSMERMQTPALQQYAQQILPVLATHQRAAEQTSIALIRGIDDSQFRQLQDEARARQAGGEMGDAVEGVATPDAATEDEDNDVDSSVNPDDLQPLKGQDDDM
jgi:predicted outer membrane protein